MGREQPLFPMGNGVDKKIPKGLIEITFLVKDIAAINLRIKSRLGIMGFSISDTVLDLWFLL